MIRSVYLKISLFVVVFVTIISVVKKKYEPPKLDLELLLQHDIFIIGSSRVSAGINPEVLKSTFPDKKIANLGLGGVGRLEAEMIAEKIIGSSSNKIILIEISGERDSNVELVRRILDNFQISYSSFLLKVDFWGKIKFIENYLYNLLSIRVVHDRFVSEPLKIGFTKYKEEGLNKNTHWLKPKDLNKPCCISTDPVEIDIFKLAKDKNISLKYFLSPNFRLLVEKESNLTYYQQLPENLKINYDAEFLREISVDNNLIDQNHLNKHGGELWAKQLAEQLKFYE